MSDLSERLHEVEKLKVQIERLREWNAEIALNAREFAAENERLRAALLTPLTEDEGVWIERRAAELFWQWKRPSGPRVQVIMAQDGIEYWTVKATHEALQARARAALDGQPAPSGWRPIDQPPSHPMRVLLFSPEQYDANWSGADYGMRVAYYANGQWRDQGTNHDAFEFDAPTHWMPLPPAPGKEEA